MPIKKSENRCLQSEAWKIRKSGVRGQGVQVDPEPSHVKSLINRKEYKILEFILPLKTWSSGPNLSRYPGACPVIRESEKIG
jgi:hypothetical protein